MSTRKSAKIDGKLHRRFKRLALDANKNLEDLIDEAIREYLRRARKVKLERGHGE